jgi:TRAP-type C4-dicarboxylate transport system permease small subunit
LRSLPGRLMGYAEKISAALFALMLGAFFVQIVSRYVLNDPVPWSLELCSVGYVWVVFFAGALILRPREQITFDIVYAAAGPSLRRWLALASALSVAAMFLLGLPGTIDYVLFMGRRRTPIMGLRLDLLYACFVLFVAATAVASLVRAVRLLRPGWRSLV